MDASTIRAALVRIGFAIGRLRPIRARVVLATAHADRLGGNLAAIEAGMGRAGLGHRIVSLTQRPGTGVAALLAAAVGAVMAGFHLATASLFVVDDYFFPMYVIRPRPGTRFVQVWHACGALKKFGLSTVERDFGRDAAFARRFSIHSNYDLCLVSSMQVAPFYAEAFGQPLERFNSRLGMPRTDVLFDADRAAGLTAVLRKRYGLDPAKRVILYAPTFRGDRTTRASQPTTLDLRVMRDVLGSDHVVLIRAHPFVRPRPRIDRELAGFAIDVSDHPDINELMLVSDLLVTDYSSAMFEFALLDRPILVLAPDLARYEAERGLYVDYRELMPGPVFETTVDLAGHIRRGRLDLEGVRRLRDWAFDVADGQATARFVAEVVEPALS
jgi:CDP-glycerol glycerophosphotransferase (TagB/SpsB family)